MPKANPQKNTLLKNAQATAESIFFKRVFFSPTQEEIQIIFFPTLRFFNYLFSHRTVLTRTDTASNVNRFGQSVCKLDTTHLRTDRRATDNRVARPAAKLLQGEALTPPYKRVTHIRPMADSLSDGLSS